MNITLMYTIESSIAPSSGGAVVGGGGQIFLASQYTIPIFLAMIFAAAVISSRTKIRHTIILVGFGIVKVPKQLSTLMGFEASFNDATGLIIFSSVAALTFAAVSSGGDNNNNILSSLDNLYLINQIEHFAIVFLGEAIVGLNLRSSPFYFNHTIYWTYKLC